MAILDTVRLALRWRGTSLDTEIQRYIDWSRAEIERAGVSHTVATSDTPLIVDCIVQGCLKNLSTDERIREAAGDTIRELRAISLQQKKNHLIRMIQLRHLAALLEECTSPLGLKGNVQSAGIDGKRFTISVRNKEGLEWKTTGSFEKLCQLLEEGSFLERFTTNS